MFFYIYSNQIKCQPYFSAAKLIISLSIQKITHTLSSKIIQPTISYFLIPISQALNKELLINPRWILIIQQHSTIAQFRCRQRLKLRQLLQYSLLLIQCPHCRYAPFSRVRFSAVRSLPRSATSSSLFSSFFSFSCWSCFVRERIIAVDRISEISLIVSLLDGLLLSPLGLLLVMWGLNLLVVTWCSHHADR